MKQNLTATEVAARQKQLQEEWSLKVEEEFEKISKEVWEEMHKAQRRYAENLALHARVSELVKELLEANPQYTDTTKDMVQVILKKYPKLDTLSEKMDIIVPYVFSIAHELEKHLETLVPEELRCP